MLDRPDFAAAREAYDDAGLDLADLDPDPFAQFDRWFHQWADLDPFDATAVALATAAGDGTPSVRYVLLKGVDHGFVVYTNTQSRKGVELAANPRAALCFGWIELRRQVRVTGAVEEVSAAEADAYFASRPRGSQLGAWASAQSEPVLDRATVEQRWADAEARFAGADVPRPPHWGGYRVVPREIEFWQGRENRLHDRLRYARSAARAGWTITRLQP